MDDLHLKIDAMDYEYLEREFLELKVRYLVQRNDNRALMDYVRELEKDIDDLQQENGQLKADLEDLYYRLGGL